MGNKLFLDLSKKEKLIVAVSGGVDSVVLLDLIAKNNTSKNIIVAHLNHGVRKESQAEAIFVENLAKKYGARYETSKLSLKNPTEENLRNARYKFLRKIKDKYNAKYIVTAHHLNDQAETVILKLIRGVGPTEIWGMKELENDLFRPLLSFSKKEIITYAKKNKLKYVEDKSNLNSKYSRNLIRNSIIPEIEKINSNFLATIQKEIKLGQELEEFIDKKTKNSLKKVTQNNQIDINRFNKLNNYFKKRVVYEMLKTLTPKKDGIYQKNVNEILRIINSAGNKITKIGGFTIVKNYDKIIFDFKRQKSNKKSNLVLGGNKYNNWLITLKKSKNKKPNKNNILLPLKFEGFLAVRGWKIGDKIETKVGTKKIQDVFTDAKIPVQDRKIWPIIVMGTKIIWVPGLQASIIAQKKSNVNNLIIEVKNEKK